MPSRVTCKSSSLCLDCLCASLYCLCFSWALWSACWILPLALHLVSFQLCLPGEISAVLVTSNFFVAPQLKFKAAEAEAMTIRFLPLMLGTLVPCQCIDRLICILGASRQASEEECWLIQEGPCTSSYAASRKSNWPFHASRKSRKTASRSQKKSKKSSFT